MMKKSLVSGSSLLKLEDVYITVSDLYKNYDLVKDRNARVFTSKGFADVVEVAQPKLQDCYIIENPLGNRLIVGEPIESFRFDGENFRQPEGAELNNVGYLSGYCSTWNNFHNLGTYQSILVQKHLCKSFAQVLDTLGIEYEFDYTLNDVAGRFSFSYDFEDWKVVFGSSEIFRMSFLSGCLASCQMLPTDSNIVFGTLFMIQRVAATLSTVIQKQLGRVTVVSPQNPIYSEVNDVQSQQLYLDKLYEVSLDAEDDSELWIDGFFIKKK